MSLLLSVTDLANGTGGTAVVAGSDVGTTNTIYSQAVNGQLGGSVWVSQGTRSGDGSLVVSPTPLGYYWWYCLGTVSGSLAISNLVYQYVSDGKLAVHERIMQGVQATIQSLQLPLIQSTNIVVRKVATDRDVGAKLTYEFPTIQIAPVSTEQMNWLEGTNAQDDVGYPVAVFMVNNDNQDNVTNRATFLLWRQKIARAFRNQRLSTAPEVFNVYVEPGQIVDPAVFFPQNLYVSTLVLRFRSREPRGFGT